MKNLIRHGVVSAVDGDKCRARVTFTDRDNLVSAWLPVLQSSCSGNKFYAMPAVGDSVVCLMMPNADDGTGFILGSFYNDKNPPPATNKNAVKISFASGGTANYSGGELSFTGLKIFKVRAGVIDIQEG